MGRPRMVTRSVKYHDVTVFCANRETRETFDICVSITGSFKTDSDLMKLVRKSTYFENNPEVKPISVVSHELRTEQRYMLEQDFLEQSKPMKKRGDKEK